MVGAHIHRNAQALGGIALTPLWLADTSRRIIGSEGLVSTIYDDDDDDDNDVRFAIVCYVTTFFTWIGRVIPCRQDYRNGGKGGRLLRAKFSVLCSPFSVYRRIPKEENYVDRLSQR